MNDYQIGIYLNALRDNRGFELKAAKAAGVTRSAIVKEREKNEAFREQEQDIMVQCGELIRAEVWRRGVDGVDKGIYYQGQKVATEKQYSDSLLLALAKVHDKAFVERKIITGEGGPIRVEIADFSNMSDKPAAAAAALDAVDIGDLA